MSTTTESKLRLERVYPAGVERVWEAWTNPEQARQWLAPGAYTIPEIAMDVRVGGEYHVVMENAESGVRLDLVGEYREVSKGKRLVYSWVWKREDGDSPETLVTVDFRGKAGETEVTIVHELFPDAEMRDNHVNGWTACLEKLRGLV